ncbi:uncharacterized protein RJT21DRAFT_123043 [Scheffersomyces amazonensis]|uniref:uncharacterized protein n=1 Tax=Scheffersomyces amazonensis TaxID=1078765 RepID=UPI00315DDB75
MSDIEYFTPFNDTSLTSTPSSQRRTSNFFPSGTSSSNTFIPENEILFASTITNTTNNHRNNITSPVVSTVSHPRPSNVNPNQSINSNSVTPTFNASKFFNSNNATTNSLDPTTPFTSSSTSLSTTPTANNNIQLNIHNSRPSSSSMPLFGGIDVGNDLSNDISNLSIMSSPPLPTTNFNGSQYPHHSHNQNQSQNLSHQSHHPMGFQPSGSIISPSYPNPPRSASTSALGPGLSSMNTSTAAAPPNPHSHSSNNSSSGTPLTMNQWSIWNEATPLSTKSVPTGFFESSSTPKLSTLEEFIDGELMFPNVVLEDDQDEAIKYPNDLLFSPFLGQPSGQDQFQPPHQYNNGQFRSNDQAGPLPQQQFYTDFQYQSNPGQLSRTNRTNSVSSSGTIKARRENIYVNKINIPTFIPSGFPAPPMDDIDTSPTNNRAIPIQMTQSDRNLEDMRQFLVDPKNSIGPDILLDNSDKVLQSKLDSISKREKEIFSQQEKSKQDIENPEPLIQSPQAIKSSVATKSRSSETIKLNLPKDHYSQYQGVAINDKLFVNDVLQAKISNKYSEDYVSTFYKRNSHGYMFIKEPTTTLKVNTTGNKSWVQLKIKLPPHNEQIDASTPLSKKLKVDIKQLPLWRPINLNASSGDNGNSSSNSYSTYGSSSKKLKNNGLNGNNKKSDYSNGNGNGNGNAGGNGNSRKPKNLNVSKRFGKRNSE